MGFGEGHGVSPEGGLGSSFGSKRKAAVAQIVIMTVVWCEWG